MLRETTFLVGGGISIGLGGALAAGLLWSGVATTDVGGWLAAAFAVAIGALFVHVGRDERRYRSEYLRAVEAGRPPPPGGPPL